MGENPFFVDFVRRTKSRPARAGQIEFAGYID
jgi:hypothetical protein